MNYFVNLVQRGVSAQTHPVSGRSGRNYGTAVASPPHGGVVFRMSLEDYMNASHDLCGNTIAGQQWVPEFVPEVGAQAQARPKCDRCTNPSVAIWDRFPFCAEHAPSNAVWYDDNDRAKFGVAPAQPSPAPTAPVATSPAPEIVKDTLPVVVEPGVKVTEKEKELPPEHLPPPFMGSTAETAGEPGPTTPPVTTPPEPVETEPVTTAGAPTGETVGTGTGPKDEKPQAVSVVRAITKGVIDAVVPQLERLIDERLAAQPQPRKRTGHGGKKPNPKHPEKAPTEFQALQKRARELGMNVFGKNKQALQEWIAEKENPAESPPQ